MLVRFRTIYGQKSNLMVRASMLLKHSKRSTKTVDRIQIK
jgi:hypothetical protein